MRLIVDAVTQRIGLGPHPDGAAHARTLVDGDWRAVFNVGTAASSTYQHEPGFLEVVHHPIEDLTPIPIDVAITLTDELHRLLVTHPCKVYIHCIAGQNRSPTVLWLYLLTLGVSREDAEARIADARFDAIPGHPRLVYPELLDAIEAHQRPRDATIDAILVPPA